jgi:Fe-S cluster assembly ATPase SufC
MYKGKVIREDGPELAKIVEEKGYRRLAEEVGMMNLV